MNDDTEQGPDPNERRRHAKKLYSEREYRDRYYKILRYEPHPKQLEAHNSAAHRLMLQAGNQQGKTHCIGAQLAIDLTGSYDDFAWYKGPRALDKDILCWAASTTSVMSRDGIQTKLLGDLNQSDGMGTGLLPLDAIRGRPTMARGISNFIDTVAVRRSTGGVGTLRLKTFEQNRQAFQSEACSRIWLDEDPGHGGADLWGECLARLTTTRGRIYFSATAAYGETPVVKYFLEQRALGDCDIVTMGINDALHIAKEDHQRIIAQGSAIAVSMARSCAARGGCSRRRKPRSGTSATRRHVRTIGLGSRPSISPTPAVRNRLTLLPMCSAPGIAATTRSTLCARCGCAGRCR
jgi:phage terminase large subunit-like protein